MSELADAIPRGLRRGLLDAARRLLLHRRARRYGSSRSGAAANRAVVVLGMHRSGTSALAGTLQELGVHLGDVVTRSVHNPKGNREQLEIVELNDAVLKASGGSWKRPPPTEIWRRVHRDRQAAIIDSFRGYPVWGFKDPRTLLTLDGWLEALPDPVLVGVFRHPDPVRRSLQTRDPSLSDETCLDLWLAYNLRLVRQFERRPFPIVDFDADPTDLERSLLGLRRHLGLERGGDSPAFFSAELRHHRSESEVRLPGRVRATYDELRSLRFS